MDDVDPDKVRTVREALSRGFDVDQSYLTSINKGNEVTTVAATIDHPPRPQRQPPTVSGTPTGTTTGTTRDIKGGTTRVSKWLKRRSRRAVRHAEIYGLKTTGQKYAEYVELHNMWCEYFGELTNVQTDKPCTARHCETILRADLHGCHLTVEQTLNKTCLGLSGIVMKESHSMFTIISKDDKVRHLPKSGTLFYFDFRGKRFRIVGDNFLSRPVMRTVKVKKSSSAFPDFLVNADTVRVMLSKHNTSKNDST